MSIDPSEHTVDELRDELDEIDDPEQLQDILDAEREDHNRKTAREAIERRLDEVGADEEPEPVTARGEEGGQSVGEPGATERGGPSTESEAGQVDVEGLRATAMEDARRASGRLDDWLGGDR